MASSLHICCRYKPTMCTIRIYNIIHHHVCPSCIPTTKISILHIGSQYQLHVASTYESRMKLTAMVLLLSVSLDMNTNQYHYVIYCTESWHVFGMVVKSKLVLWFEIIIFNCQQCSISIRCSMSIFYMLNQDF